MESFETQRITKDGRQLDVWLTVTLLTDEEGKPALIATTERDVTSRKRSEKALRRSLRRLSLALEGAQMGIWEWDLRADRLLWNALEYQLLGLPVGSGEVDTETFFERVHPDDLHELRASLASFRADQPALSSNPESSRTNFASCVPTVKCAGSQALAGSSAASLTSAPEWPGSISTSPSARVRSRSHRNK